MQELIAVFFEEGQKFIYLHPVNSTCTFVSLNLLTIRAIVIQYIVIPTRDPINLEQRQQNQQVRRIRAARFPVKKSLDDFDFKQLLHVEEALIWQLATGEFIDKHENIIAIGNPGTGKTHLLIGLGIRPSPNHRQNCCFTNCQYAMNGAVLP